MLLARFKGKALKLAARLGIACALASACFGALSTEQPVRRVVAAVLVLAAWIVADRRRRAWAPDVLADAPLVLGAAAVSTVPFAIDGHTQSNVFLALAPLAGVAAVACRRRDVALFTVVWSVAYLVGTVVGGGGPSVLVDAAHPFDVLQQLIAIVSMSSLSAFAVYRYRGFVADIPRRVNERRAAALGATASLNERETEVLQRLGAGQEPQAVAAELFLSEATVKDAINSAMDKLGARSRREAVFIYYLERADA